MTPSVYYNEIDQDCAAWLQALMDADAIPLGDIDTRSIEDVTPNDVRGYTQCHFFAGIGGWAYALDLAGWSRDRPVWTGSCPCQPFSAAGKGAGFADERHLWPAWQHLIAQCRPAVVLGEQVSSKHADAWIDLVHADMEGMGYAFGCIPFPAADVGAPHKRDRFYYLADADLHIQDWNSSSRQQSVRNQVPEHDWREDGPRSKWVVDGVSNRMAKLRGYGNAIVPQAAAAFVRAYLEARAMTTPSSRRAAA